MNSVRYWLGLLTLMATPPGIVIWFLVHPFAGFWRRAGPWMTYMAMAIVSLGMMAATWMWRVPLMGADLGTNYWTVAVGLVAVVLGGSITIMRKRHLTTAILSGLPEVSPEQYPGKLLQDGIYGIIRNPRYVEVVLWVWGYALVANHVGVYVLAGLTPPALYLVVLLEERELRQRFGEDWDDYAARVPRFIPRGRRS